MGRVGRRINACLSRVLAVVTETSAKTCRLLVLKNSCTDLIDLSAVGSIQ